MSDRLGLLACAGKSDCRCGNKDSMSDFTGLGDDCLLNGMNAIDPISALATVVSGGESIFNTYLQSKTTRDVLSAQAQMQARQAAAEAAANRAAQRAQLLDQQGQLYNAAIDQDFARFQSQQGSRNLEIAVLALVGLGAVGAAWWLLRRSKKA